MAAVLTLYRRAARLPGGRTLFSVMFARKAPYFATVRPRFVALRPDYAELRIANRRSVRNHLGTVHAIAVCNGLEAAMGALAEASIPREKRWIPQGMDVRYTAKASSDLTCVAETDREAWTGEDPAVPVRVRATRDDGTVVVEGTIYLWVTPRPARG